MENVLNRIASWALAILSLAIIDGTLAARASAQDESMAQATTTDTDMSDAQARAHFRLGASYYEQGRFADAAQEFEIAYGLSGRGQLLYNVYLAYRDAQDTPNAARALRGYLSAVPDAPDHEHLQARLTALEATVTADQEAEAARTAAEAEQRRQLEEAERRAVDAEARASAGPPPTSRPWWPWVVFGGGAAAAIAGAVLAGVAGADADALRSSCVVQSPTTGLDQPLMAGTMCSPSVMLDSRRSTIMSEALAADVLWIGGAVIAITGLVLALVLPDDVAMSDSAAPTVTAGCGPTGCTGNVSVRF